MIVQDPALATNWLDYGILIPFPPARPTAILNFLGARAERFPGPVLNAAPCVTPRDIERVHASSYTAALSGAAGAAARGKAILEAYELIDENGAAHRYDPARARKPIAALYDDMIFSRLEGACFAAYRALDAPGGFCYYLAGGNHHARYDYGTGFCVLNDMVIAARKLQAEGRIRHVWIIDVDVHKGCGTAELIAFIRDGRNPQRFEDGAAILSLSIHMAHGWPLDAETLRAAVPDRAPLIPSDVEIPLKEGEEPLYCAKLAEGLQKLEANATDCGAAPCELAIVVDGSDPYEHDGLASSALLNLSLEQCLERDMLIYDFLRKRKIPSVWVLAGGYGERAWEPPAYFLAALAQAGPPR